MDNLIKSGSLNEAVRYFEQLPLRDVVTWNLLISGHHHHGFPGQAICLYAHMVSQGIRESSSTFASVLGVCSNVGFHREGLQVHCRVIILGFSLNIFISSSLIDIYMDMGQFDIGLTMFEELREKNIAVWNVIFRGFCNFGLSDLIVGYFSKMKLDGVEPNGLTFSYLLRGCSNGRLSEEGKQVHCLTIKTGYIESNLFVANALVDFYSACGSLIDARKSLEIVAKEDLISWNSIVSVHAEFGLISVALEFFSMMHTYGKKPSIRSLVGFLNYSSENRHLIFGNQIHCCVIKLGFDYRSVHIQSALIDMYGKCGEIKSSMCIFEDSLEKATECCNSLMTSLSHSGLVEDTLEFFGLMIDKGFKFDEVSLSITLKALSDSAFSSLISLKLLHCCSIKSGFESYNAVSCSLIDAYSKSGHIEFSCQIFENIHSPNVICFTSIICGYAHSGMGRECLKTLKEMIQKGLKPDNVTILCVLMGCSHSGLIEDGKLVFGSMENLYGISPNRQHYSCMVDLLGRAGLLDEAEELLEKAQGRRDPIMWGSLLRSCTIYRNERIGRRAAKVLMDLQPGDCSAYLQASSFYSQIGDAEASMHIREVAMARKMSKEIGCSFVALN